MRLTRVGPKKALEVAKYLSGDPIDFQNLVHNRFKQSVHEARRAWDQAHQIIEECNRLDIQPIAFANDAYPRRLQALEQVSRGGSISDERPPVIYVKGNYEALHHEPHVVAIVGTRKPTKHGEQFAFELGRFAARKDIPVVSGLAYGCDQFGHQGCLDANGTAIAVLAHGLDHVYPPDNEDLANNILHQGCWISEYPPGVRAKKWSFVARDRLQSALSDIVVVIQTGLEGGTQHTVKYAVEQRKQLACVEPREAEVELDIVQGNLELIHDGMAERLIAPQDLSQILDGYRAQEPVTLFT